MDLKGMSGLELELASLRLEHRTRWVRWGMDAKEIERLKTELAKSRALVEKVIQTAQGHAMESRTMRSIVYDIYQGLGIQKGDWNGAKPVLKLFKDMLVDYGLLKVVVEQGRYLLKSCSAALVSRNATVMSQTEEIGKLKAEIEQLKGKS